MYIQIGTGTSYWYKKIYATSTRQDLGTSKGFFSKVPTSTLVVFIWESYPGILVGSECSHYCSATAHPKSSLSDSPCFLLNPFACPCSVNYFFYALNSTWLTEDSTVHVHDLNFCKSRQEPPNVSCKALFLVICSADAPQGIPFSTQL